MLKIAGVRFISANGNIGEKIYYYSTNLNLIKGYKYNIENNEGFRYSSPVVVIFCTEYDKNSSYHNECWSKIRYKITKAVKHINLYIQIMVNNILMASIHPGKVKKLSPAI